MKHYCGTELVDLGPDEYVRFVCPKCHANYIKLVEAKEVTK